VAGCDALVGGGGGGGGALGWHCCGGEMREGGEGGDGCVRGWMWLIGCGGR